MDDNRPDDPGQDRFPDDWRYFGPFAPQPEHRSIDEPTQPLSGGSFPAPPGVEPLRPVPAEQISAPVAATERRRGGAGVVVGAGLAVVLLGGAAGFTGALLADRQMIFPTSTSAPSSAAPASPTGAAPSPSATRTPASPAPRQIDTVEVAKTVLPSTVMIRVGSSSRGATGSGFVLDDQGRIMTNNHVVAGAANGGRINVVFSDGSRRSATMVGRSPSYDLAVIKVSNASGLRPMQIGDSDSVQVGESVVAVGSPLALPGTVTEGIISAKNRPVVVNTDDSADSPSAYINGIQTDAAINPGNSGGPLIDAAGRVIGVNSAILTLGETREQSGNIGLGFAIPINQAMDIGAMLIKDGKATYPIIGANVEDAANQGGVRLTTLEDNGPADKAGLRVGDVITNIDGQPVYELEELIVAIRTHRPGEVVTLAYERDDRKATAKVTLGGRDG